MFLLTIKKSDSRSVTLNGFLLFIMISMNISIAADTAPETATAKETDTSVLFAELTLNKAVELAQRNDLWLVANHQQQQSIDSMSIAANSLPDPKISLSFANIPTDNFQFGQDPMSQFKVGVSQALPRGDSLKVRQKQLQLESSQYYLSVAQKNTKPLNLYVYKPIKLTNASDFKDATF